MKTEGARCPRHRGLIKGKACEAAPNDSTQLAAAAPVRDGRTDVHRRIEALTVQDVVANKAARKALCGLARMILATYDAADKTAKRAASAQG